MGYLSRSEEGERWTTNDLDKLFWALSNAKRRAIVDELQAQERPVSITGLARTLAGTRGGITGTTRRDSAVDDLSAELFHRHVPALVRVDVVEFNETGETIEKGEKFGEVAELLTTVREPGGE